ncbi:DinB family protein [Flavobacteriaceae bacterium KMM 6897]|nr:DinB family protein [Flavobacteriaceae bacterium KMM 6897]MEB8345530.1 DinB family protein [Flavobacteriaceae bacterium KMM 6898]
MRTTDLRTIDYNSYYQPYIEALGDIELMEGLKTGMDHFVQQVKNIPEEKLNYAYGVGKWTILEVLVHLIDTERIFQYRALRFYRNDKTPLPGFDQDEYVPVSHANKRTRESIVKEYIAVRQSTIALFESFEDGELSRTGVASSSKMSVGAVGLIIAGHQKHHQAILESRYL